MALIKKLEINNMSRNSVHDEVDATYSTFVDNGRKYLQIDSYGRSDRDIPGKKSQSIQIDEKSALVLFNILRQEFKIS